jgi:hypothetical protein
MRKQLQQDPTNLALRQQAAVLASHIALLLYALSELGLFPDSSLVRTAWRFSRPLLQDMAPADVAMFAVACGRFGAVPNKWWRNALLRVTQEAAAATAAAAAAAAAGRTPSPATGARLAGKTTWAAQPPVMVAPSSALLNPADISSLLTAAHSMNLEVPTTWVASMFGAALAQLTRFSLCQTTVMLMAVDKLKVQPTLHWLTSLTQHALTLASASRPSSSNGSSSQEFSSSSSSPGSSLGSSMDGGAPGEHSRVGSAGTLLQYAGPHQQLPRPRQPQLQQQLQQQQQQQHHHLYKQQQQQRQLKPQRLRHLRQPDTARLCLYLLALSKAVGQVPEGERDAALLQLQPLVAAAATQIASDFGRLKPLDLVQLLLGLQGLRCRPGPAFMAAFADRCVELSLQTGFNPSLYGQLKVAYMGLGLAPPRQLLALMVAALSHDS